MIVETDGTVYENLRSLEQELTFNIAAQEFSGKALEFGAVQQQTLGIRDKDGLYNNLGLLLSDQCPHIIKAAVFQGSDRTTFRTRSEFSSSLFKQMQDAFSYIKSHMPILTEFEGLNRRDTPAVSGDAAREAVLNALIHRDYSVLSPTLQSFFSDRIEIASIGGLPQGISLSTVNLEFSVCRNYKLANVFYRLGYVEAYSTGLMKIADSYKDSLVNYKLEITSEAFMITHKPNRKPNGIICFDASALGLAMDDNMRAELCVQTVDNATLAYPELSVAILHTDRGSQYTSELFRQELKATNLKQSMNSAGGRCHDNARCESMWARMKWELFYSRAGTAVEVEGVYTPENLNSPARARALKTRLSSAVTIFSGIFPKPQTTIYSCTRTRVFPQRTLTDRSSS